MDSDDHGDRLKAEQKKQMALKWTPAYDSKACKYFVHTTFKLFLLFLLH